MVMAEHENLFRVNQYLVSPELFVKGYPVGSGPCSCTSTCCEGGVYADLRERDNILRHADMIKKHMDETQTRDIERWFDTEELEDSDFASGRCIGTAEVNGKCAFLNERGWCSLQVAATAEGMHKWAIKPLYCVLYPIEITGKVISFDWMLQNEQACCSIQSMFQVPLFEACREELVHLLGEDGYSALEQEYTAQKGTSLSKAQS